MKARLVTLALTMAFTLQPVVSYAAPANYSGTLLMIGTDWSGNGYIFQLNGAPGPCQFGQFSMSSSSPGYKDQVATLMLAWAQGDTVTAVADGTCPNNRANIIGIYLAPPSS